MVHHAIVGAGGVGGLIGAALAKQGDQVTLIVRPETVRDYPRQLELESPFGNVTAPISVASELQGGFNIVWFTVKATQLESLLKSLRVNAGIGRVAPLLNGIDHVQLLRERFGNDLVVPATIAVESERVAPGKIVHRSLFARLNVASSGRDRLGESIDKLSAFGFECKFVDNEATLLWSKLCFLAPFALTTSASGQSIGAVLADRQWRSRLESTIHEATALASASGASVDEKAISATFAGFLPSARSSMQKDVAAGLTPELDAIAGPIIRGGETYKIPTPATRELVEMIRAKLPARG